MTVLRGGQVWEVREVWEAEGGDRAEEDAEAGDEEGKEEDEEGEAEAAERGEGEGAKAGGEECSRGCPGSPSALTLAGHISEVVSGAACRVALSSAAWSTEFSTTQPMWPCPRSCASHRMQPPPDESHTCKCGQAWARRAGA